MLYERHKFICSFSFIVFPQQMESLFNQSTSKITPKFQPVDTSTENDTSTLIDLITVQVSCNKNRMKSQFLKQIVFSNLLIWFLWISKHVRLTATNMFHTQKKSKKKFIFETIEWNVYTFDRIGSNHIHTTSESEKVSSFRNNIYHTCTNSGDKKNIVMNRLKWPGKR